MIRISVIIVNFNTRALLRDCLLSIAQYGGRGLQVIVVDNHSHDGSVEMVRDEFPEFQLIENDENLGFARANNRGIRLAQARYLLLLNSDTLVRPGALQAMEEFLDCHPQAGAITCRLLNADGSTQACVSKRPGPLLLLLRLSRVSRIFRGDRTRQWLRRYLGFLLGASTRAYLDPYANPTSPIEVENISGACLMLRREAINGVGYLNENFFMYFEDIDYCIRMRNTGWKMFYVPAGEIVHLVGQSSGQRMRDYSVHAYRGLFYLYRRHYSTLSLWTVRALVLIASSLRWLWSLIGEAVSNSPIFRQNRLEIEQVIRLCLE